MAEERSTIKVLDDAYITLDGFVTALEPAATSEELKAAEKALADIMAVRNHLDKIKTELIDIITTCRPEETDEG